MFYKIYDFEIGKLAICEENEKIVRVQFLQNNKAVEIKSIQEKKNKNEISKEILQNENIWLGEKSYMLKETALIKKTKQQLDEYFAGKRKEFDIPIKLEGTDFQIKVWKELLKIPYGETYSYLDIAKRIGNPKASRAVGMANNKNKIIIIVPCHRVIGSNKKLVGYACGLDVKEKLLELEKEICRRECCFDE